jgi:hypothetical protein
MFCKGATPGLLAHTNIRTRLARTWSLLQWPFPRIGALGDEQHTAIASPSIPPHPPRPESQTPPSGVHAAEQTAIDAARATWLTDSTATMGDIRPHPRLSSNDKSGTESLDHLFGPSPNGKSRANGGGGVSRKQTWDRDPTRCRYFTWHEGGNRKQ